MKPAAGTIPSGWALVNLGDIVAQRSQRVRPQDHPDTPLIGLGDVEPQTMRVLGHDTGASAKSQVGTFLPGNVLYGRLRPYLNEVAAPNFSGLCSGEFIVLEPSCAITSDFLRLRLNAQDFVDFAGTLDTGDRPRVKFDQIAKFEVALPPLAEQDRIVAALSRFSATMTTGLEFIRRAGAAAHQFRRSVLREALGDVAPSREGVPIESYRLSVLPRGWEWSTMAQEGEVRLGRMRSPDRHQGPHMRSYLRVANVFDDELRLDDVDEMDFPPEQYEVYRLIPGDILLNEGQTPELLGRAAMWRGEVEGMCYQKALIRFRAGERILPDFALLVFRHYLYTGRFKRESRITTGIAHLTAERFAAIEFPVPPMSEQQRIVGTLHGQMAASKQLEYEMATVATNAAGLTRALARDAFSGALVSQDSSDEQATVSVARALEVRVANPRSAMSKRPRAVLLVE